MNIVIIGAGIAGLSAGYKFKKENRNFLIIEKEKNPGGLARSVKIKNFIFDYTGHLLHLRKSEIKRFIFDELKLKNIKKIRRKSYIYSYNTYTEYPYQINNYGLPYNIIEENLVGLLRSKIKQTKKIKNFKEWVLYNFGEGIAKNFMFPYNEKLWKVKLDKLTTTWMGRFVPELKIDDYLNGIIKSKKNIGYNAFFYYPERGGIEVLPQSIYKIIKENVLLNEEVKFIDIQKKIIYLKNKKINYDYLISTMPLKYFLSKTNNNYLKTLSRYLKSVNVYGLNIGFKSKEKINKNWIYFPEKKYIFYRITFPHTFSNKNVPEEFSSLCAEVSFTKKLPHKVDKKIIDSLLNIGIINNKKDIKLIYPMIIKDAYVIYDKKRDLLVKRAEKILNKRNIFLAGRWGRWEYSSMEDAIISGFRVADTIIKEVKK